MKSHGTTLILDDIYEPTIPERKGQVKEPEEMVLQPQLQRAHAQRRMG